jgi:hypothetical protein
MAAKRHARADMRAANALASKRLSNAHRHIRRWTKFDGTGRGSNILMTAR